MEKRLKNLKQMKKQLGINYKININSLKKGKHIYTSL